MHSSKSATSRPSFLFFLTKRLAGPITDAQKIEDISYSWSADDLHAAELERDLIDGVVWQIQPLEQGQPWGIFVLEFKNAKLFTAGRGMASVLRKILRGLVSSRRKQARSAILEAGTSAIHLHSGLATVSLCLFSLETGGPAWFSPHHVRMGARFVQSDGV